MRKQSKSSNIHKHPVSAESRYARSLGAGWLARLLDHNVETGFDFLACLAWSLGSLRPLILELRREIESQAKPAPSGEAHGDGKKTRGQDPLKAHREQSAAAVEALRQILKFAVRQSKQSAAHGGKKAFARSVLRIAEAHDTLKCDGHPPAAQAGRCASALGAGK